MDATPAAQRRTITVRRARNADLPDVTGLEALIDEGGHGTTSPAAVHRTLVHFVAVNGGKVVGTVKITRNPAGGAEVARFAVATDARGRGVGAALLAMVVSQWPARTSLRMSIHRDNTAGQSLFTRAGWVRTDEVPWDQPDASTFSLWALSR